MKYLSIIILCLLLGQEGESQSSSKKLELGFELEVYPAGCMPVVTTNVFLSDSWAMRFRLGANFANRRDWSGLNDDEKAKGIGGSVGIVKYYPFKKGNILVGFNTDLWKMKTTWIDDAVTGTTTNLVVQPWMNGGYIHPLSKNVNGGLTLGIGREINTLNKGEAVGQGWMGIITASLNFRVH